ncbi:MAG: rfbL protein, partial [Steroidobacteraceae bacterium]
ARVPDALRGDGILVVASSSEPDADALRKVAAAALKELGIEAGDALHVSTGTAIPETATGKPVRRTLSEEFVAARSPIVTALPEQKSSTPTNGGVLGFVQRSFPGQEVGKNATFESLGGDSLGYIQFSLGFEKRFGALPSGWESLTVEQLERSVSDGRGGFWRHLESATLGRAFFMICIVALHLGTFMYSSNFGAAYFLFMLAGYSVSRFQWPEISRTGKVWTLLGTVSRVAVPSVLMIVAMQLWTRHFELKPLLLISNFFDPRQYHVAYFYFSEIYMQLLLIVAAIFSFRRVREMFRKWPMLCSTALLVASIAASHEIELYWDTNYLFHRTPHWCAWAFASGMVMASAAGRSLTIRALALAIVGIATVNHFGFTSAAYYVGGACAVLLFMPELTVPLPVKTVVGEIAGSSMFMYLSHAQVRNLVTRLFHAPMPWVSLICAIGFGVLYARCYGWAEATAREFAGRHWNWPGKRTPPAPAHT